VRRYEVFLGRFGGHHSQGYYRLLTLNPNPSPNPNPTKLIPGMTVPRNGGPLPLDKI